MLTEIQLAAKRTERNMRSRCKRVLKRSRYGRLLQLQAEQRSAHVDWLAKLGREQKASLENYEATLSKQREERRRQMSTPAPKARIFDRFVSLFKGRGR